MKNPLLYILLVCQIIACKTDVAVAPTIYQVSKEIEVYVDKFIEEAKIRGREFKKENLLAEFGTIDKVGVCGQCSQANANADKFQKKITIVKNNNCWTTASEESKEALIFHELGHCWLGRIPHNDNVFPNGSPVSIMNSSNENPYGICQYDISNNGECDKRPRRKYYIDELFDEKTALPVWGK
jgi:hypothetical protein